MDNRIVMCAWCCKPIEETEQVARHDLNNRETIWHAHCFVTHLAYIDEQHGVTR